MAWLNYFPLIGNVPSGGVSCRVIPSPARLAWFSLAVRRGSQAHPAAFLRVARQRHVPGLTMAAEVSVHFPARPFGPCGSSGRAGKAVR
jgi:hypothetical protein